MSDEAPIHTAQALGIPRAAATVAGAQELQQVTASGSQVAAGPAGAPALEAALELSQRLRRHRRWFVLTGAGCSTESGIPAYRDETGAWRHKPPIQLQEFVGSESVRRRYWARSFAGFPRVERALPNAAHHALAQLEREERVRLLVTQNVDRLHQKAGSRSVIDLHGQLAWVACLRCRAQIERERMQEWLASHNPNISDLSGGRSDERGVGTPERALAPDADAQLEADASDLRVPPCPSCGGVLKPDVVFFGETVPPQKVRESYAALEEADAVLVVGSSLAVFSGYRFVRRAAQLNKPIVVVNSGTTRADGLAQLKLGGSCGAVLSAAVRLLAPEQAHRW
jgi:NAD-dependent SIR2 family protein deacetylase